MRRRRAGAVPVEPISAERGTADYTIVATIEHRDLAARVRSALPQGSLLPEQAWQRRHRGIVALLWTLVPVLVLFGVLRGKGLAHSALEVLALVALAVAASTPSLSRRVRGTTASLGLVMFCGLLVHLWDGRIEAHFSFFVVVALLMLYQDWLVFLLAIGYVVFQHGVVGVLDPASVFDHPGAQGNPWRWALIHGGFVVAASVANMASWRANEQLLHVRQEARTDELTGLLNRRGFYAEAEQALDTAREQARPLGLLLLDLDRFKELNDTFGHHAGDELLCEVAARLQRALPGATLARLGGDEFVALVDADSDATLRVARGLLDALEPPVIVEATVAQIGGSIGVAGFPDHADTRAELLRYADAAMYRAKRQGSGVELYTSQNDEHTRDRLALAGELHKAIADEQLVLHFQPKVDLISNSVCGVEALVRWQHPQRGLLYPDAFITLAEQHGLMRHLTLHVLTLALRQERAWRRDGIELPVAVNVSPANLLDLRFADDVAALLSEWEVTPGALQLEITENTVMLDPTRALDTLARLSELGITFALDDFGTGYSSLAQLKRLPVDELKVDRSFVIDMVDSHDDATIVRSTIELARNLGLRVVAEGVETQTHSDRLMSFGCHIAQGYHLSRPLPACQLTTWLHTHAGEGSGASTPDAV